MVIYSLISLYSANITFGWHDKIGELIHKTWSGAGQINHVKVLI
jgi:hypothetical protein